LLHSSARYTALTVGDDKLAACYKSLVQGGAVSANMITAGAFVLVLGLAITLTVLIADAIYQLSDRGRRR
jgi:hypothetical protein